MDSSEWKPPENNTIKVNFDASFNFLWENISDPVMVEARACLQAITMVEEMGFQDICIEGDALTVIRKLNSREANKAAHGMAMEGWRHENPQYWIEEIPCAVEGLVDGERRGNREVEEMES